MERIRARLAGLGKAPSPPSPVAYPNATTAAPLLPAAPALTSAVPADTPSVHATIALPPKRYVTTSLRRCRRNNLAACGPIEFYTVQNPSLMYFVVLGLIVLRLALITLAQTLLIYASRAGEAWQRRWRP